MAAAGRRTDSLMKHQIVEHGYGFEFFQAVRVLERLFPGREPIGGTSHPSREVARFGIHVSLAFPASEIHEVVISDDEDPQPAVLVNFFGLAGPSGVLPHHYTELLLERAYLKDRTLRDFLDLFNHRMISLFYRAWEKYRLPAAYERGNDACSAYLTNLVGFGTGGLRKRLTINDQVWLYYGGLLLQRPHCACNLEGMVRDYFGVPAEVRQFHGHWVRLGEENETRLNKQNQQLGFNAVLGSRVWDRQSKFRLRLGPIGLAAFERLLPGGYHHTPLMEMSRLFAGLEFDFDVQLVLKAAEVPACRLRTSGTGARLGWSSWLKTKPFARDAADTVLAGSS
jgi:type VI secretion system protein ImpH